MMEITENKPKVSVCVVTYNQENYIRQCLQSIIDQEVNFEYEIIVGEDCSSDGTKAIVQEFQIKYPMLFRPIFHRENVGVFENYRRVHFAARGEYIAHLDGDDYWHPGKLQSQIEFMGRNQNCTAVYTNAWVQNDSGEIIGVFSSGVRRLFDLAYLIQKGNFLTNSSIMYRTELRKIIIPPSGNFVDFLLHIRLAQYGQLGFIDRNLVSYTYQSATSLMLREPDNVNLLLWDALQQVDLPKNEMRVIDKAKYYFIAKTIISEFLPGGRHRISKWVSLLSNDQEPNTLVIGSQLIFFAAVILGNRALDYLHRFSTRKNAYPIIYRK